jgi:acetyl esterase/lipase
MTRSACSLRLALIVWGIGLLGGAAPPGAVPPGTNVDEAQVPRYTLPDPLTTERGQRVTDATAWRARRAEILRAFETNVYGRTPKIDVHLRFETRQVEPRALGGLATRKEITIHLFDDPQAPRIDLLLFLPNRAKGPVPTLLGLNYYGNQCVHAAPTITASERWMRPTKEMGIVNNRATVATRGAHASRWDLARALTRGYAVATFYYGDLEPDWAQGWRDGLRGYLLRRSGRTQPAADDWGAIGVWAWGLSRALDYLVTDPAIDGRKVVVFGHSRQGKTALWAGAQDERFAVVISNNSGEGGASLARRRFGETIADSIRLSGYWYAETYRRFANNEAALPTDQHMLVALAAPRPVYVASADQDLWADPRGEFLSALNAEPVYRLLGRPGLGVDQMPAANHPVGETIGYHLRRGPHNITSYDWEQYLRFADRHFGLDPKRVAPPDAIDRLALPLEPARQLIYKTVGQRNLRLHVFGPEGHTARDRRPAIVFIHGGGWSGGSPRRFYPFSEYFVQRGMVALAPEYRLISEPGITPWQCVEDGRSAIRWVRRHADELGIDPQQIVVAGGSAGGHVAAATALCDGIDPPGEDTSVSCRPSALVLYFPVIDTSPAGYGNRVLGPRWRELSPLARVRSGVPPTIVFHGTADTVTPYAGAVAFRDAMQAAGNHCELVSHPGGKHGYLMSDEALWRKTMEQTEQFLRAQAVLKSATRGTPGKARG